MAGRVMAHTPTSPNTFPLSDDKFLVSHGVYKGISKVNKFGRAPNVAGSTLTDIHDGANTQSWPTAALDDRATWTAPTQARVHSIVSTSTSDTQTIKVFGLTSWSGEEVSEDSSYARYFCHF